MASFAPNKIDTTAINGGQRYQNGDVVDANAINAPIEASAWAQQTAEEAQVKADFALQKVNESEIGEITLSAYPIGSIYLSVSEVSPASLFGGFWLRIKDAFLWASGDLVSITYTKNGVQVTESLAVGSKGGEATHTLTVGEMPTHNHHVNEGKATFDCSINAGGAANSVTVGDFSSGGGEVMVLAHDTENTGSSQPHNNMPPYYAVNAWVRVTEEEFNANESL